MHDNDTIAAPLQPADPAAARRAERRRFMKFAGGTGIAAGAVMLSSCFGGGNGGSSGPTPTPTPTPTSTATGAASDITVMNFLLQLEYLTAQFFSVAATGSGLNASLLTGSGTQGGVTGGRAVAFADPLVAAYAREIAANKIAHVNFLRLVLGVNTVAMPAIDIDGSATGAFTAFARGAGLIGSSDTFDPYASDANFLLAAFLLLDVSVTAYKGGTPVVILTDPFVEATTGLLGAESYHAGLIRTTLYQQGAASGSPLLASAKAISDRRDALDGSSDQDQPLTVTDTTIANITPADANGIVFSRSTAQVLNILYNSTAAVAKGCFFPAGVNGAANISGAVTTS